MPVASQKPPPKSDAQEAEDAPAAVVQADFELERVAGRPADQLRGLIRKEHMRDEAEHEADGADIEHEGVDEEDAQHVAPGPRPPGHGQMQRRQQQAQQHHGDVDHAMSLPTGAS